MGKILRFPIIAFYAHLTRFIMCLFAFLGGLMILALVFTEGVFIPGIGVYPAGTSIGLALWDFILFFSLLINGVDFIFNWNFYMEVST